MKALFYTWLIRVSRGRGEWIFHLFARFIALGYFLFFPKRTAICVRFYRILFPDRSPLVHIWSAFRQFQNFTGVFLERMLMDRLTEKNLVSEEGLEHLTEAIERGTGGIIVMSHMGNWEVAARLLARRVKNFSLLMYVGKRPDEQIESLQKRDLANSGLRIVVSDTNDSSRFDLIEALGFLKHGGFVSMTGDRIWSHEQRTEKARFLGHETLLPVTPHVLAWMSGAPLFFFFTFHSGKNGYAFSLSPPTCVGSGIRNKRNEEILESVQNYANLLEKQVRLHPFEWYHFEPFLLPRK